LSYSAGPTTIFRPFKRGSLMGRINITIRDDAAMAQRNVVRSDFA
jgi:hypothetical protein